MTHKTPDPIEALIKTFLTEGTKEGYGDLSGMVSHIKQAHAAGVQAGREKERDLSARVLRVVLEKIVRGGEEWESFYSMVLASKDTTKEAVA